MRKKVVLSTLLSVSGLLLGVYCFTMTPSNVADTGYIATEQSAAVSSVVPDDALVPAVSIEPVEVATYVEPTAEPTAEPVVTTEPVEVVSEATPTPEPTVEPESEASIEHVEPEYTEVLPSITQYYYDDAYIFGNYHYNYQGNAGTIYIPSVGMRTNLVYGETQDDINSNDIITETASNLFGMSGYNTACGHNTRSLGALHNCSVGDRIYVYTDYATFVYEITLAEVGHVDDSGYHIVSDTTGDVIFKYGYDTMGSFKMYTCYAYSDPLYAGETNSRFVVNAKLV